MINYYIVETIGTEEVLHEGTRRSCEVYLCNLVQDFGVNKNNFTIYRPRNIYYKSEYIENWRGGKNGKDGKIKKHTWCRRIIG